MKTSDRIPPRSSAPPLEASDPPTPQPEPAPQPEPHQPEPEPAPAAEPAPEPQPPAGAYTWDSIANAPTDGSEIMVRYEGEAEGRLVRWKHGRRFTGRRWVEGGRWVPANSLQPLPAVEPTHWARPPDQPAAIEQPGIEVVAEGVGYETPPEVEAA